MQLIFNDIYFFFLFHVDLTNPKFLVGWPEKQQINLEWPYRVCCQQICAQWTGFSELWKLTAKAHGFSICLLLYGYLLHDSLCAHHTSNAWHYRYNF